MARTSDHFPFTPQSPRANEPFEFWGGGQMNISSGAAIEVIWFGIFGIELREDGSMTINPVWHNEIGECELTGFTFRNNIYDVVMKEDKYTVWQNGKRIGSRKYGSGMNFKP